MKLAHYQIEHIQEYIDGQNIWYDDIKIELIDHIVCNIEHQMEDSDIKFVEAAAITIKEIDPASIQKERLKVEHIATFKEVYHEIIDLFSGSKIYLAVVAILAGVLLTTVSNDLEETLRLFSTTALTALFVNFFARTYFNRKFKPLYNSFFMSRLNTVYTSALLSTSLIGLLLTDWLVQNPVALIIYISTFNLYLIASFRVLNRTFNKLKNHVAYR
ncbi:hypothetical protein [uncultured Roseivirga sp.]|uniref:hypothetical protein n=1 Tax=uncultured Roseivirga sp. TaxID=543088 RepID=UPI0030DBAADB|tara:strand:+ start:4493 stop:5140 length:648 start_codon:yes stop_codon:yes gene_type:complete